MRDTNPMMMQAVGMVAPQSASLDIDGRNALIERKRSREIEPFSDESLAANDTIREATARLIERGLDDGDPPVFGDANTFMVIHPSSKSPGFIQVTRYNNRGIFGDSQYSDVDSLITDNSLVNTKTLSRAEASKRLSEALGAEAEYQAKRTREQAKPVATKPAPLEVIVVDGVERPATNSRGHPIHSTREGLDSFWRWFGGSRAVDEHGRPLVVYHGTTNAQVKFKSEGSGCNGKEFGGCIYTTDNIDYAEIFSLGSGVMIHLYVKTENPVNEWDMPKGLLGDKAKRWALANGYDAIISSPGVFGVKRAHQIVVFSPEQIKFTNDSVDLVEDYDTAPSPR